MQKLKEIPATALSNYYYATKVVRLPESFDPKTQAVFLIDLEKDHFKVGLLRVPARQLFPKETKQAEDPEYDPKMLADWELSKQASEALNNGSIPATLVEFIEWWNNNDDVGRERARQTWISYLPTRDQEPEHVGSILEKYWDKFLERYNQGQAAKEQWIKAVTPNTLHRAVTNLGKGWISIDVGVGL